MRTRKFPSSLINFSLALIAFFPEFTLWRVMLQGTLGA